MFHQSLIRNAATTPMVLLIGFAPMGCSHHPNAEKAAPLVKAPIAMKRPSASAVPNNSQGQVAPAPVAQKGTTQELWVQGYNNQYIPVVDEFEQHLYRAEAARNRGDARTASMELRGAANLLGSETKDLKGPAKTNLAAANSQLTTLAGTSDWSKLPTPSFLNTITQAYDRTVASGVLQEHAKEWAATYGRPTEHIMAAQASLSTDRARSADDLKKAKAYIDADVPFASGALSAALRDDSQRISKAVDEVAAGKLKDPAKLQQLASETARILARVYYQSAEAAWQRHDATTSAQWLSASIFNQRQALSSSGKPLSPADATNLNAEEGFASSIRDNTKADDKKMESQLKQVGIEMNRLLALSTEPAHGIQQKEEGHKTHT